MGDIKMSKGFRPNIADKTKYEIAKVGKDEDIELAEWMRILRGVISVENDPEEEIESQPYYHTMGVPLDYAVSRKDTYSFEGHYDDNDEALNYIRSIERKLGEGRIVFFRVTRPTGQVLKGEATVTEIVTTGGESGEYEPFEFTITFNGYPEDSFEEDEDSGEPEEVSTMTTTKTKNKK